MNKLRFFASINFIFFVLSQISNGTEFQSDDCINVADVNRTVVKTQSKIDKKLDIFLSKKEEEKQKLSSIKTKIDTIAEEKIKIDGKAVIIEAQREQIKEQNDEIMKKVLNREQLIYNVVGMEKEKIKESNANTIQHLKALGLEKRVNKNSEKINKDLRNLLDKKLKINKKEERSLSKKEKKTEKNINSLMKDQDSVKDSKTKKEKKSKKHKKKKDKN